jgi:hypothetical protein
MHVSIDIANAMFVSHHASASRVMIIKMFDVRQKAGRERQSHRRAQLNQESGQKSLRVVILSLLSSLSRLVVNLNPAFTFVQCTKQLS